MPNPIDSENVIAWLNVQIEKVQGGWLHDYGFPTNVIAALTDVKRFVKNLPTVEAEPVRHGYWIIRGGDMWCSECGYGDVTEFGEPEDYRYCPNCGAKMDRGGNNAG